MVDQEYISRMAGIGRFREHMHKTTYNSFLARWQRNDLAAAVSWNDAVLDSEYQCSSHVMHCIASLMYGSIAQWLYNWAL